MRICQFWTLTFIATNRKTAVDEFRCYGRGICRAVCPKDAIHLDERPNVAAAAQLWGAGRCSENIACASRS
jgi:Fe-S-cluster-containing hydrogenase component 2